MRVARSLLDEAVPLAVQELLRRLDAAGAGAMLVGGTVRDLLLGLAPRDFDVATALAPEAVRQTIPTADLGDERFGVARVRCGSDLVSIATFRADGAYADRRHPDSVRFVADHAEDARRRDFTVNALYLDFASATVLDPTGGLEDLRARRLCTVGEPARRFDEDPLRLLRLARFAGRLGFTIEERTAAAARAAAESLRALAAEACYRELTDLLTGAGRGAGLRALVDLGLAAAILPEVDAMREVPQPPEFHPEGDVLTHTALVLDHVPDGDAALAWAAVLHDVGKPLTLRRADDRIRFDGHDVLSATMAEEILRRLHAPRQLIEPVVEICRDHIRFASLPQMRPRRRERWLRSPGFTRHLAFHRADCLGSHGLLDVYDFAVQELERLPPVSAPLVTGKDALALGVTEGPLIGRLLARVHAEADDSSVPWDRARALVRLREIAEQLRQGEGPGAR